jgi:hypothetical protein
LISRKVRGHMYQLFVGGLMFYLCYLCLFCLSIPQLFVGGLMFYLCYLCLFCSPLPQLFVGGLMFYLCYLCLFCLSLPPVVCRRAHVLIMLFVFVRLLIGFWNCLDRMVLFVFSFYLFKPLLSSAIPNA